MNCSVRHLSWNLVYGNCNKKKFLKPCEGNYKYSSKSKYFKKALDLTLKYCFDVAKKIIIVKENSATREDGGLLAF